MITTTLNRIREYSPCQEGWTNLLAGLGKTEADDEPLPFATILEINGLADALCYCRAEPQYDKEWRLLAVKYARRVQHLNTDPAVKNAIDVAERYANGKATGKELTAAGAEWAAARAAAWAAAVSEWAAAGAARAAAGAAAKVAALAASRAAEGAEWAAAWAAALAAARAAAGAAAGAAALAASRAAEREYQAREFLRVVTETEARAA
jgi:hypothetical protein